MNTNLNFSALQKNLIDMIKEAQIKIGYEKTSVAFYYPPESLCALLGDELSETELLAALSEFCEYAKPCLGTIKVTAAEERFRIEIPAEGAEYVHEKVGGYEFLEEFIKTVSAPCTMEDILAVFKKYSDNVKCVKADGEDEFEYVVYFPDGKPDDYYYCILPEFGHATYHRFTPADYKAFGFEYK